MTETTFTPGPWSIVDRPDLAFRFGTDDGWEIIVEVGNDKQRRGVAICPGLQANAHLIAAAPTLYEALAECLDIIKDADGGDPATHTGWASDELCDLWMRARAALAKARGEAQ